MDRRWLPFLAFLLGVTLTVGVYESLRLVRNTSKAWNVASNQLSGSEVGSGPAVPRGPEARGRADVRARPDEPAVQMRPLSQIRLDAMPPTARNAAAMQEQAARKQAIRERLEEMSPEEREALRQRRLERRDRKRDRLQALREVRDGSETSSVEPGPPPEAEVDTGDLAQP